ncbi:Gfo/Idh/MocA family oxidoreductase, partial [bacterium]|nr:Gfo/Idh/MocA family oxidoreductase [candidate division CSSED10-310 bacterium]
MHFLKTHIHVLVEKPITENLDDGKLMIETAKNNNLVLMVGQSERFNPAISAVSGFIKDPRFIEVHRLGPFTTRAIDVDVVLDLMIHDVDLILKWVDSDIIEIRAMGVPVLSDRIDIANARIEFQSGCTANITASRISMKSTRKVRVFQPESYVSIDCMNQTIDCFKKRGGSVDSSQPMNLIEPVQFSIDKVEPLKAEITAFIESVKGLTPPPVPGEAGLKALDVCQQITHLIRSKL